MSSRLSGLLASTVLAALTPAHAADLGGNCCADLEERIAELEATTARKGNRKVSLTISGWVAQQVTFWDDGRTKNAYVGDAGDSLASHVTFSGEAKISADWSAGYVLYIEAISNEAILLNQKSDNASNAKAVNVYQSFWFLKSKQLGQLSLGQQSGAADNQAFLVDGSGSSVPANFVMFDNSSFFLVRNNAAKSYSTTNWGSLASCGNLQGAALAADCEGIPTNNVKYDTPVLGGFSASASWGENDAWAVSGRYAADYTTYKVAAAIAYFDTTDNAIDAFGLALGQPTTFGGPSYRRHAGALQTAGYIQHKPTGLFLYGVYAKDFNGDILSPAEIAAYGAKRDADDFYIKAGIRQKWTTLGHTVLYGEYGENNDKTTVALHAGGVTGSNITQWGVGLVQDIDAAAMQTWLIYRNFSAEQSCKVGATNADCVAGVAGKAGKVGFQDIDIFKVGGLITF